MGQAQVRIDERFEADRVEGCPQLAERPAHQAQVDAADDSRVLPRQRLERAVPKPDRLAWTGRPLRGEARVVEQRDEAIDGLGDGGRRGHMGSHRPTPSLACSHCDDRRLGLADQRIGEDLGELAVGAGIRIVGIRPRGVPQAGSPATRRRRDAAGDEPRVDELVELPADGVRVEPDGLGELTHTDRTVSLAEDGEESRAGQPGENAVTVLWRCHGLHFAREVV